jgi:DNA-binding CsgD family transcriptional regulator/tetratricopeptide (TPR) repeat protein
MESGGDHPARSKVTAGFPNVAGGNSQLVGRHDALHVFGLALDTAAGYAFRLLSLVGEPGAGKTRLLGELAAAAERRKFTTLWGRAAEFEQEMPFAVAIDALDDHVEACGPRVPDRLGADVTRMLATVFPSLRAAAEPQRAAQPGLGNGLTDITVRYGLYRAVRQLLGELAAPRGLVLILDDVHWADESAIELLDHLARHPPRGRVLVAVAYRPAQASPRLEALAESAGSCGRQVPVEPLSLAEAEELLGPGVSRRRCRSLYEMSGGNPFYLEALVRMDHGEEPAAGGGAHGELPAAVRAALQLEVGGLSPPALLLAQGAAVAADEFEPALAAVAAEVSEDVALKALNEMAARDIVRTAASTGRFRFRHPLIRRAIYDSASVGWRLAAHARVAAHLSRLGAPAARQAHHVARSASLGDRAAIATLLEAARGVAAHAPATAARWLEVALRLMPDDPAKPDSRLELLLELARLQAVSGQLVAGRDTAQELLRRLPPRDHARRAQAARFCALMERQLGRPHEAREILLDGLRRIPDPRSPAALPLRTRLVAESLMRGDIRAAQAVLDLIPEEDGALEPAVAVAIAALRPLPAYAAGRITDAARYIEVADRLVTAAPDEHLAEWLDAIAWLCWTETVMGRHDSALARFERAVAIARSTGQSYIVSNLLAGRAQVQAMLGRLREAAASSEEAAEVALLLGSGPQLVFALTQQCLAASWSGDSQAALRFGEQAVRTGKGSGEWSGALAQYARAMALINSGRREAGAAAMDACSKLTLDRRSLLSCCEVMASVEEARGRSERATMWADWASKIAGQRLDVNVALAALARAHALCGSHPEAAATEAAEAARLLDRAGLAIDAGRARLCAGIARAAAGDRAGARAALASAAQAFEACGARSLHAQAVREQRRLGVRIPAPATGQPGQHGLTRRELDVANLVAEGCTNQEIAERLYVSIRTVETHLSHIFDKLGATSRTGVVKAMNEHLQRLRPVT